MSKMVTDKNTADCETHIILFTCAHFNLEFLDAVDDTEPPSDLIAEQRLAELEHSPHGEGKVDKGDILVTRLNIFQ